MPDSELSVYAVLLTEGAADTLITRLVGQGLTVGPRGKSKHSKAIRDVCCAAVLTVSGVPKRDKSTHLVLLDMVMEALEGFHWFFLLVDCEEGTVWSYSNITLPQPNAMQRLVQDGD